MGGEFQAPERLTFEHLVATPLRREHLEDDLAAVNSSHELIRQTRGGSWPEGELSREFDFLDLAWHEREFRDGDSFAYVVYTTNDEYVGCFYLYPAGTRTPLDQLEDGCEVDVSWWVSQDAYKRGEYEILYQAIIQWIQEFPFTVIYYSKHGYSWIINFATIQI